MIGETVKLSHHICTQCAPDVVSYLELICVCVHTYSYKRILKHEKIFGLDELVWMEYQWNAHTLKTMLIIMNIKQI